MQVAARRNLSERIAQQIKEYIVENNLKPGDRLPTEHDLAERFGVSRISIREATKALAFLGIVDAAPRRGMSVGHVDLHRVSEFLGFHLALSDYPLEQLIETRIIVEGGGLAHTMERMAADPEIFEQLSELNRKLLSADQVTRWVELDIAFHRQLLDASGLKPLVAFNDLLEIFFQRVRESVQGGEWVLGVESHQRLLDHLQARELAAANHELRDHIESHKHRMGIGS
ncbi:MAG: GntR family transcriptional regulator [Pirellulaceae bacterium]|jgi:GntR family transcriptional repressor for pyruvate dehydrogenase complex|nr:GntR family transcriptional regulator [Pirellulaceae bacterium]